MTSSLSHCPSETRVREALRDGAYIWRAGAGRGCGCRGDGAHAQGHRYWQQQAQREPTQPVSFVWFASSHVPAPVLRAVHGCAALDALEHSKARKSKSDEKLFIFFVPRMPH
jgi:hypothetical protein